MSPVAGVGEIDEDEDEGASTPPVPVQESLLQSQDAAHHFPCFSCDETCNGYLKTRELLRLSTLNLDFSKYIDAVRAKKLLGQMLRSHQLAEIRHPDLMKSRLHSLPDVGGRLGIGMAFMFDIVSNAAYLHRRVKLDRWIFCEPPYTRGDSTTGTGPSAFYSFLKQCPNCSVHHGIEKRIPKSQHKPSSHHIGEITATITALILKCFAISASDSTFVALVTKQNHDADAVIFSKKISVILEIKSSPLVSFPLKVMNPVASRKHGAVDGNRHIMIDLKSPEVDKDQELFLSFPHADIDIPVGSLTEIDDLDFPYKKLGAWLEVPENYIAAFSAWLQLYDAYAIPKTKREGRNELLAYLTNGWGDEIDSNKTKAGLGRTDDLKKGTYQLIKYGAYYRQACKQKSYVGGLCANLDPMFHSKLYLDELAAIRWFRPNDLTSDGSETLTHVPIASTNYLYDAIFTFNNPRINNEDLRDLFSLERVASDLLAGRLDRMLNSWISLEPETPEGGAAVGSVGTRGNGGRQRSLPGLA